MSTNKINNRKHITIDTKVAIINAVAKREKLNAHICRDFENQALCSSVHHFKTKRNRQDVECYPPFIRTLHSSLFPIVGIMTPLAITTLLKRSTVVVIIEFHCIYLVSLALRT